MIETVIDVNGIADASIVEREGLPAEHPEFGPSGADAVAAGMASDAAAYDAEKAITFEGWRMGSPTGPAQLHRAGRGCDPPELHGCAVAAYPELSFGAP